MNWITILWPMAIAACLTLAIIHVQITMRLRGRIRAAHAFFTLSAIAVAVTGGIELKLLHTADLASYQELMRWAELPICLMILSLGGFVWTFFAPACRGLAIASAGAITTVTAANFFVPAHLAIRHAVELRTVETFGRVKIIIPRMENSMLTICEVAAVVLLLAFVICSARASWRIGERRRAISIGGSIIFFLLASRAYALLVEMDVVQTPFFFIFPFLGLLLAMGHELSLDIYRAARLADQLRESEERTELAARAATLGFWVWDLKRDDLWATGSARTLFGVPSAEPLNFGRFTQTLHADDVEMIRRAVERSIKTGEDYDVEYRIVLHSGEQRWIAAKGRVERGNDGNAALMRGVVIDITDRKAAQMDADEMRRELAHVTRVSTMGELAASIAHELNQPLAAILSNAQAARRFLAAPAADLGEIRNILDDIVKDDKRAGEVIHRLRALVQKKESAGSERVCLNELVHDAERLMNSELIGRNVELELHLAPNLPDALANRVEIQQVLLNLMVNAMEAMRDVSFERRKLEVTTIISGGLVRVAVRDTGPGIPDSIIRQIFRPFFTTKQHGLGMGLAICRTMIESHGGKLWAENHPAGGALFQFELRHA